jgi:replicative DNA helicase
MNHEILANLSAERAVIGGVLIDPDAFSQVADLPPEAFFGVAERAAWEGLKALEHEGKRASDPLVVADQLVRQGDGGKFEGTMGPESVSITLVKWAAETPAVANVGFYADLVRDRWKARQALTMASALQAAVNAGARADDLLAKAQGDLAAIAEGRAKLDRVGAWDAFSDELEKRVVAVAEGRRSDGLGIPMGIGTTDRLYLGGRPGNTTIIAAEPGGGKSSYARQWAWGLVCSGGAGLIFSREMGRAECMESLYSHAAQISSYKLAQGLVQQLEWRPILDVEKQIRAADLVIDEDAADISQIESAVAQWAAQTRGKRRLWFVDYIQLVTCRDLDRRANRADLIATVSRRAKLIAQRTQTHGVLVAQLNRQGLKAMAEPTMHDLEGSGALEKDASAIALLSIAKDDKGKPTGEAAFRMVKQRGGPVGKEFLRWDPKTYTFSAEETPAPALGPASGRYGGDDF